MMAKADRKPQLDIRQNIKRHGEREHRKARERYVDVTFSYPDEDGATWEGAVPIEYPRGGVSAKTAEEVWALLEGAYEVMRPSREAAWHKDQEVFWATRPGSAVTKGFFDVLAEGGWKCQGHELPNNPNFARRIQDIKDQGYTIATERGRCPTCGRNTTHLLLLRLPRGAVGGYETMSPKFRARVIKVLEAKDVFRDSSSVRYLLPDHKFPEVRWDAGTKEENPLEMTPEEIRTKFQLMTNQRNQQKREVCRHCYETGERGIPYGIEFFYEGGPEWPDDVPRTGKAAEAGCVGCGWYDTEKWREALNEELLPPRRP